MLKCSLIYNHRVSCLVKTVTDEFVRHFEITRKNFKIQLTISHNLGIVVIVVDEADADDNQICF